MTQRERFMGIGVLGTVGAVALYQVAMWTVIEPLNSVKREITRERRVQHTLERRWGELVSVEKRWKNLTRRTLSEDPKEAQRRFRTDVHELLEVHGLSNIKVSPGSFIKYKDDTVGVPLTINAVGTLEETVLFLRDFYRRDYLARLDKVRLTADQSVINRVNSTRRRSRSRRGDDRLGPEGPELRLNISAVTLVLPRLEGIEHPIAEEITELEYGRLAANDLAAYDEIYENNLFAPYEPTPVVSERPKPRPEPGPEPVEPPVEPPVEIVSRRDQPEKQYLTATESRGGNRIAWVLDERERDPDEQLKAYHQDDEIDDGVVALIHPRGMVVRVAERDGSEKEYFYPLRVTDPASFAEREELDPDAHPRVYEALQQAFVAGT
jgi:hypothetical protein